MGKKTPGEGELLLQAAKLLAKIDKEMRNMPEIKMRNYTVMQRTILYLRVCSSLNVEDTLRLVNEDMPPGTSNNEWVYTDEPLPGSGDPRTVPCGDAEARKHYVFNC